MGTSTVGSPGGRVARRKRLPHAVRGAGAFACGRPAVRTAGPSSREPGTAVVPGASADRRRRQV